MKLINILNKIHVKLENMSPAEGFQTLLRARIPKEVVQVCQYTVAHRSLRKY